MGQTFRFDLDTALGDNTRVNLPHPEIIGASEVGHTLMVDDGKVKLVVTEKGSDYLKCRVDVPGKISNRKGVNTPDSILQISPLTPKDRSDLDYMLEIGVDWVALSFVQRPADIEEIREIIDGKVAEGEFKPSIMAKIEKPSCFDGDNLQNLVRLCDGVMVARGDLGVECPPEDVPILQKTIIDECRKQGRPVVVATQMLESMIENPTPTRAEASDVATAIYDGADAIMLSAESAAGKVSSSRAFCEKSTLFVDFFFILSKDSHPNRSFCRCSTRKNRLPCNSESSTEWNRTHTTVTISTRTCQSTPTLLRTP
jgi:pyruvate kinase